MENYLKLSLRSLQMFAEGGGDGGTAAGATTGVEGSSPGSNEGVKTGITSEVQTADVQQIDDRQAKFDELIKGEYKDLYDKRVSDTIQKRLKSTKDTVDRYNALAPTLQMLGEKYGVDASDVEALSKAIEDDDSYYEDEALEKGLSVEQLKNIKKMERENAELKRQMHEQEVQAQSDQILAGWMDQAERLKTVYPTFRLDAEMQNPRFIDLLRNNIDVRTAYEVLHKDEIIPAAMQFTANQVQQKTINAIRANGARPNESGMGSQSTATYVSDVSQLTPQQRKELIARAARGERITLKNGSAF